MEILAAIDIRCGRSVRLAQGDFSRETTYGDPLRVAETLIEAGARWLHLVDLDAAETGEPVNRAAVLSIASLASEAGVAVEVGGGIRSTARALELLDGGVSRVVIGTAALEKPGLIGLLAREHPGAVAVALDHRQRLAADGPEDRKAASGLAAREVAVRGWVGSSGIPLSSALDLFRDSGAAAVVVTDISRDGMLTGPDLDGLADVLEATDMEVVASGGVRSIGDIAALAAMDVGGRSLGGVIVGKAISEGMIELGRALDVCASSG
ncbi:MAG: 1-(5-phosphoribosyl)-5-[(5-phosphoribosylamino)methylideneamino]imidazole-4-carboxamide isomerase [Acidimicrobiales bacterium]